MKHIGFFRKMKLNTRLTVIILLFTVVPIAVLAGMLYYNMEQNVVDENISYMSSYTERNADSIRTTLDSVNMSTQFFLSDDALLEMLKASATGKEIPTDKLLEYKVRDVAALERLVNNNPLLYSVRAYSVNNGVQELMPVLYTSDRMKKLSWTQNSESIAGWKFDYYDTIFSTLISKQDDRVAALVTEVNDYRYGTIGYIESAVTMKQLLPGLYEEAEDEWSVFVTDDDRYYTGTSAGDQELAILQELIQKDSYEFDSGNNYQKKISYVKLGGKKYVIGYLPVRELCGTLIRINDITADVNNVYTNRNIFVVVMILILIAVTFAINAIVSNMLKQLYVIIGTMRKVRHGDLEARMEVVDTDNDMGELANQLNMMLDRIRQLNQENINREVLVKDSEIRALQNQINAHFIYNVLETIKMMAEINEEYEISDSITALGKLLRYSMKWTSANVLLREELDYIRNYLTLINLRFDYEIILSLNIPEELLDQEIPKMSLQPIVENAILHGIEEVAEDTTIYIKTFSENGLCRIEITDAGRGMTEEELQALRNKIEHGLETKEGKSTGIGIRNVADRIRMGFGPEYGVTIDSKKECYTKVSITLPLKLTGAN